MKDFIFIVGPSGVGKTTLAKKLFEYYRSVYIEQNMIPEFITIDGKTEVTGKLEEETLFTSMIALLKNFNSLGYKNVIGLDFNDLRCRDIPDIFKGYNYITIKLVCSDYNQNLQQMLNRGKGLIDEQLLKSSTSKIINRQLLVNEFLIDIKNKTIEEVFKEAVNVIENKKTLIDYNYEKPPKELFHSWVKSDDLN